MVCSGVQNTSAQSLSHDHNGYQPSSLTILTDVSTSSGLISVFPTLARTYLASPVCVHLPSYSHLEPINSFTKRAGLRYFYEIEK
mmetsp:Transcript_4606/g.5298  ORF Transcript_4606/g.5298 Transcript_4606/m.5298 type:complete len:85 (+) Transcript_4606:582-836(+)